jgi:hypothetical protein
MGWPAAFRKAGATTANYLAMTMAGEAWFVTPWESFAAAEKEQKAFDANATLTAELGRPLRRITSSMVSSSWSRTP